MNELIFNSPQEYLNYDFDDNFCFFYDELRKYGENHPSDSALVDYEGKFQKIITNLFKIYDALIIDTEQETLTGLIGKTKILIKQSPSEG